MKKFTFLIPVYNDWSSLKILLEKIELQLRDQNDQFSIMILNDFSTLKCDISVKCQLFSSLVGACYRKYCTIGTKFFRPDLK